MAELKAFTIEGVVEIFTKQAEEQLEKLGEKGKHGGEQIDSVFGKAGNTLLKFAGPAILGALSVGFAETAMEAAKMGSEIHDAVQNFIAATGAGAEEAGRFEQALTDIHGAGVESFEEIAGALTELRHTMGPLTSDSKELAETIGEFARVTHEDAGDAVKMLRQDVQGFGKDMGSAAEFADLLAAAERETGAKAADLGHQLGQNAFLFQQYGLGVREATSMLALFNKNGVDGNVLLTGMTRIMEESESPTDDLQQRMHQLGIRFDELGKPIGGAKAVFQAVMKVLQDNKSSAQDVAVAFELLGKRSGPEFARGLTGGKEALDEMNRKLRDTTGAVKEQAEALDNRMGDALTLLKRRLEPVQVLLGKAWTEIALGTVKGLNYLISQVQDFGTELGQKANQIGDYWDKIFHHGKYAAPSLPTLAQAGPNVRTPEEESALQKALSRADAYNAQHPLADQQAEDYQGRLNPAPQSQDNAPGWGLRQGPFRGITVGKGDDITQGYRNQDGSVRIPVGGVGTSAEVSVPIPSDLAKPHPLAAPTDAELEAINYYGAGVKPGDPGWGKKAAGAAVPGAPAAPAEPKKLEPKQVIAELDKEAAAVDKRLKLDQLTTAEAAKQLTAIQQRAHTELKGSEDLLSTRQYLDALDVKAHEARAAANAQEVKKEEDGLESLRAKHQAGDAEQLAMIQRQLAAHMFSLEEQKEKLKEVGALQGKIADANEDAVRATHKLTESDAQAREEDLQLQLRGMKEHGVNQQNRNQFEAESRKRSQEDQLKSEMGLRNQILQNDGQVTAAKVADLEQQAKDYSRTTGNKLLAEQWLTSQLKRLAEDQQKVTQGLEIERMRIMHNETAAAQAELAQRLKDLKLAGVSEVEIARVNAAETLKIQQQRHASEQKVLNDIYQMRGQTAKAAIEQTKDELDQMGDTVSQGTKEVWLEEKRLALLKQITQEQQGQNSAFQGGGMSIQEAFGIKGDTTGKSGGLGSTGIFASQQNQDLSESDINAAFDKLKGQAGGPTGETTDQLQQTSDAALAGAQAGTKPTYQQIRDFAADRNARHSYQDVQDFAAGKTPGQDAGGGPQGAYNALGQLMQMKGGAWTAVDDATSGSWAGGAVGKSALQGLGRSTGAGGGPASPPSATPTSITGDLTITVKLDRSGEMADANVQGQFGDVALSMRRLGDASSAQPGRT